MAKSPKPTTKPAETAELSPSFLEALDQSKPGGKPTKAAAKAAKIAVEKLTFDSLIIAEFTRRGFADIRLRENVLTWRRWIEQGRIVKRGEKAVHAGPLRLYHASQTEPLPTAR